MTTQPFFPSWKPIPVRARFTVQEARIHPGDDITPGKIYEAHSVGARQVWFRDDAGRQRMLPGSALRPAS